MAKKTVKDLSLDFDVFKKEFQEMKTKFDTLQEEHASLEDKFENLLLKVEQGFKCGECETESKTREKQIQKKSRTKNISNFNCDKCDKIFNHKVQLSKHIQAAHTKHRLYCHFFNNNKDCPYRNKCIFIHEDSDNCKYGEVCDRINCMFKHYYDEDIDLSSQESADEDIGDVNSDDGEEIVTVACINDTFINPSIFDQTEESVSESIEMNVFVKCRNMCLQDDREYYIGKLESFPEIEKIENLWISRQYGYREGTYLSTNIKFLTKFADQWKNDEAFRKNVFDRLEILETCPRGQ